MKMMKLVIVVMGMCIAAGAFAQHIDTGYEVGTWQGFRTCAVTYTFDDNCANQFVVAIPMFNQFGFKMTLFPVINWTGAYWAQLQAAASQGHEIGSHTMTHPDLSKIDSTQQIIEQGQAQSTIETRIPGQKCISIAYPYCATGDTSITRRYYLAARTCSGQIMPKSPSDFMNISSLLCGNLSSNKTAQALNTQANTAAALKGWLVYLFHGIDTDNDGYSPILSAELRGSLAYLDTNRSKFWVAPFGTVARYIKERNAVSVTETAAGDSMVTCTVTDALNDTIFNVPVTVRRLLPTGWLSATVTQNGSPVSAEVVEVSSKKYVMFDAVPDAGDVRLSIAQPTGINSRKPYDPKPVLMQNYPNPVSVNGASTSGTPVTTVSFNLPSRARVSLKVFDALGREVSTVISGELAAGTYNRQLNTGGLPSGVYFYRLVAGNVNETRSFVLVR